MRRCSAMRRAYLGVAVLVGLAGLGCRGGSSTEPDGSPPADAALVVTDPLDDSPVAAITFPATLVGGTTLAAVKLTNAGGASTAPINLLLGGANAEDFAPIPRG
jgi:hypothetical protein